MACENLASFYFQHPDKESGPEPELRRRKSLGTLPEDRKYTFGNLIFYHKRHYQLTFMNGHS